MWRSRSGVNQSSRRRERETICDSNKQKLRGQRSGRSGPSVFMNDQKHSVSVTVVLKKKALSDFQLEFIHVFAPQLESQWDQCDPTSRDAVTRLQVELFCFDRHGRRSVSNVSIRRARLRFLSAPAEGGRGAELELLSHVCLCPPERNNRTSHDAAPRH